MADERYVSEHSGTAIDSGVSKGESSVQSISVGNVPQPKDANGNVNLQPYPTGFAWGTLTGNIQNQSDLNTELGKKLDKNVGTQYEGYFAGVDSNGNYTPVANPKTALWGNITGSIGSQTDLTNALAEKVDKVTGKSLTSNDYSNTEKAQVAKIANIEGLIPNEATTTNQLADKDYVNQQVASNSGTFKGLFNNFADLPLTGNNKNDVAHVKIYNTTTHEEIGYSRYKWSIAIAETNKWLKEYDVITNTFTPAQNAAIDSGITSAKVSTYDNHINNTNNPHNVTTQQLGLENVVNTGDSAIPTENGTTKFTTGGAYTELNKKVDKTTTIGTNALGANISAQNIFDDIKDLIGTFTHKVIDGVSNTLQNIGLGSLANQGGQNAGKPLIVGNTGAVVLGDNTPTYVNISNQVSENAYNQANGAFNHCKMVLQNDMVFYNIDYSLTNPVIDKQSAIRKVMELPALTGQFAYPQKINVRLTQAVCQPTSMEEKNAIYNPSGSHYVNPRVYESQNVFFQNINIVNGGSTYDGNEQVYIAQQATNNGFLMYDGLKPIVLHENQDPSMTGANMQYSFDSCPFKEGTTTPAEGYYHNTSNNKWYLDGTEITVITDQADPVASATTLGNYYYVNLHGISEGLYKVIQGYVFYVLHRSATAPKTSGWVPINSYTNAQGNTITGNFWKVRKVIVTQDMCDYMYKAHLADIDCRVNSEGVWGRWVIQEDIDSKEIGFDNLSPNYPINHGAFGTATFVPEPIESATDDVFTMGPVINNTLYVPGIYSFSEIQIGAGGIL